MLLLLEVDDERCFELFFVENVVFWDSESELDIALLVC